MDNRTSQIRQLCSAFIEGESAVGKVTQSEQGGKKNGDERAGTCSLCVKNKVGPSVVEVVYACNTSTW